MAKFGTPYLCMSLFTEPSVLGARLSNIFIQSSPSERIKERWVLMVKTLPLKEPIAISSGLS